MGVDISASFPSGGSIEEVMRDSRKLKPMTSLLKGQHLHASFLLMRQGPYGVLDTSVRNRTPFFN
jgi:hypothetical protein